MGTKVRIPRTPGAVDKRLNELGQIATAVGWERAALVAARVRLTTRGARSDITSSSDVKSPKQFADLGIYGLKSQDTVKLHVQNWLDANNGEYPELGKSVDLPDGPYPPTAPDWNTATEEGAKNRARSAAKNHPTAAAAAATASKEARRAAKKAIDEAEKAERTEQLRNAGISEEQREARRRQKQAEKEEAERQRRVSQQEGNEAVGEDWEAASPTHRGVGLLGLYVHGAETGVENLLTFLNQTPEESGADWRDHNAVAGAVDRLDDTQKQLADCIALLEAALASLRPMTTADFE